MGKGIGRGIGSGHFCGCMIAQVDEFIAAYPALSCNDHNADGSLVHPLPKRGDFVRFVKRHDTFTYEQQGYIIRLVC